ncbi:MULTISPECIES: hypothetical protein [Pseudomonas]|uniref:CDI immunity protein domain-containing protein n=1 Tax=Pseudomonas lini TaxID=163011 RepID=A0A423IXB5_9PSED|nr:MULTISPECIES: hypothetical protein [Pseudomonas]RON30072.1 hypothetical protein BK663_01855 [Pseudomonas lini]
MNNLTWLKKVREVFGSSGLEYEDLYGLMEAAIIREKTNFPAFLYEASRGFGFCVGEGYFYCLDQDWDEPKEFDEVSFFLGEVETSSISVSDYISLMGMAADVYSNYAPDEKKGVLSSVERLKERYVNKLPISN